MFPREKLVRGGLSSLTDTDLIAVVLGTGVDGRGVKDVARHVTKVMAGRIRERRTISWDDFLTIRGVGRVKAMQLSCAIELGRRIYGVDDDTRNIRSRNDVIQMFSYLSRRKQEHVVVLALDARNGVIGNRTVAVGSLNKSVVEPRDIFSWVLSVHAASVILVHNHPSGDKTPSPSDTSFLKRITQAGELLGIPVLDSVIV